MRGEAELGWRACGRAERRASLRRWKSSTLDPLAAAGAGCKKDKNKEGQRF